jgi:hypothetical protein
MLHTYHAVVFRVPAFYEHVLVFLNIISVTMLGLNKPCVIVKRVQVGIL